ncbi:hypothetical protein JCM19233_6716 [Vibrio astriarenae]|nr:hypothetical protein JCM19233_6716 [Vibrio sp. C7]
MHGFLLLKTLCYTDLPIQKHGFAQERLLHFSIRSGEN